MFGFVSNVVTRIQHKLKKEHKKRLVLLLDEGVPLDRTWKVCADLVEHMDENRYTQHTLRLAQSTRVRSPYKSLETYLKTVLSITEEFRNEVKLDRSWSTFETLTIPVMEFMQSEDGFYLPPNSLAVFIRIVKELLELIQQAEHEELGVTAHNVRVLIPFFVRLRDTLLDLYDIQFAL